MVKIYEMPLYHVVTLWPNLGIYRYTIYSIGIIYILLKRFKYAYMYMNVLAGFRGIYDGVRLVSGLRREPVVSVKNPILIPTSHWERWSRPCRGRLRPSRCEFCAQNTRRTPSYISSPFPRKSWLVVSEVKRLLDVSQSSMQNSRSVPFGGGGEKCRSP